MRPPFNSFQPQPRPQRQPHQQQQNNNGFPNHHQHNGYQNNPQMMMNNPMMGHMNNQIRMPNMPIHPQFFNNLPNMPQQQQQQQQQQQLQQFAMSNHINQLLPSLLGNLHNLMGHSLPLVQPNFFPPPLEPSAFTSQPQLNSFNSLPYPPVPNSYQNHQLQPPPGFSEPRPQGQAVGKVDNTNGSGSKGNDFRNNFTKHQKFKGPGPGQGQRFQNSQLHQTHYVKRNFNKDHSGKGNRNKMANGHNGSDAGNKAKAKKRLAWAYTPKEVQRWRDARRKHFPTKLHVEQKLKKNVSDGVLDEEAKMRRQQLQEILAQQAELEVEVAEVPSHYLSNTDEQVNGDRGDNNGQFQHKDDGKKGRFQNNRYNKRRHGGKDKSSKKPRLEDKNSSQESCVTTRKPTLLEKLLSADIKREKSQLLQALRFMVINSFLKESPEQPLKLPLITVEEIDYDDDFDVDVNADDDLCDEAVD
ncbi:hypothetical protein V5N11_009390 [Cardamine amara subsp. amara]|uniref:FMR1-interacting protein 1 conserved domain-containing protein n=1 Tax=Cardamine amara subsp. amara TaxID=228776 RepID=A0ABD0ZT69_CARAN